MCINTNGKDTKHTSHISGIIISVRNGGECNIYKTVVYDGRLKLEEIVTDNVREEELNPGLGYDMVRPDHWHNPCTRGAIG